jgi:hypothetical protein
MSPSCADPPAGPWPARHLRRAQEKRQHRHGIGRRQRLRLGRRHLVDAIEKPAQIPAAPRLENGAPASAGARSMPPSSSP